jgi:hypothetical protein
MLHDIADRDWFELQFNPELAKLRGIPVPGIPSEHYQVSFTGLTGRQNLEQACSFYKLAHEAAGLDSVRDPQILDFGGGWGRIARFWLRDTPPQNITVSDTMDLAISLLRELKAPYHIAKNPPFPPADYDRSYDLIYAFSVFSHLSEKYTAAWVDYLLTQLKPQWPLRVHDARRPLHQRHDSHQGADGGIRRGADGRRGRRLSQAIARHIPRSVNPSGALRCWRVPVLPADACSVARGLYGRDDHSVRVVREALR